MDFEYLLSRFNSAISFLPDDFKGILFNIPDEIKIIIDEIRLRIEKEISFTINNKQRKLSEFSNKTLIINKNRIENSFNRLCDYSVYSHQEEINNGFITIIGGHRVGICGTYVYDREKIINVKDISSLNIRVSREVNGVSNGILKYSTHGLLIAGPPASGKTTILRDLVYNLSNLYRVSLIDSRGEIAAVRKGVPENIMGDYCDVLNLANKVNGIEISIRTLNPQIIAFDEVNSFSEVELIKKSLFSGVKFILTIHIGSKEDFLSNELVNELLLTGAIRHLLFLDENRNKNIFRVKIENKKIFLQEETEID